MLLISRLNDFAAVDKQVLDNLVGLDAEILGFDAQLSLLDHLFDLFEDIICSFGLVFFGRCVFCPVDQKFYFIGERLVKIGELI